MSKLNCSRQKGRVNDVKEWERGKRGVKRHVEINEALKRRRNKRQEP